MTEDEWTSGSVGIALELKAGGQNLRERLQCLAVSDRAPRPPQHPTYDSLSSAGTTDQRLSLWTTCLLPCGHRPPSLGQHKAQHSPPHPWDRPTMINALKHPSFFRPASRPTSPAPAHHDLGQPDRNKKLALNTFRRPTPAPGPLPQTTAPSLVQDGTYLEMLSLKLSEAVSKALAQPAGPVNPNEVLAGKRPLPAGRGAALGAVIVTCVYSQLGIQHELTCLQ
jgi:hypothetical protein